MDLPIKTYILNTTISLFFIVYLFKQTLFLGAEQYGLNFFLLIVGLLTMAVNLFVYGRREDFIIVRKKILLIFLTIVATLLLFENTIHWMEFLFKFLYMSHFIYIFIKCKNSRMFIFMADLVLAVVLLIVILSHLGFIESHEVSYTLWQKNFGGFNNPNTAPFFVFSVLTTYFIFGLKNRYYLALSITLFLFLLNIYSRTFWYGSILLVLYQLIVFRRDFFLFFLNHSGKFLVFISSSAFLSLAIVLFYSENLGFLMGSNINDILSNRIDLILSALYVRDDTISGINFIAFDNVYYELIFIYGPVTFWIYHVNILRILEYVRYTEDKNMFLSRLCVVAILMSFIGLFEGVFTKISPITILLFIILFINHKDYQKINFSCKNQ